MPASNFLERAVLDHVLGEGARDFVSPTTLHVALFTTNPDEDATGAEVATGSYTRQPVSFNAATIESNGLTFADNDADITFPQATSEYTVSHIGIYDADGDSATDGNLLFYGAITGGARTVSSGDTFQIQAGQLVITLN